jgi:hypothetical protein
LAIKTREHDMSLKRRWFRAIALAIAAALFVTSLPSAPPAQS